jgi:hypothetical protein
MRPLVANLQVPAEVFVWLDIFAGKGHKSHAISHMVTWACACIPSLHNHSVSVDPCLPPDTLASGKARALLPLLLCLTG